MMNRERQIIELDRALSKGESLIGRCSKAVENVCLFDLDGTLCDYDKAILDCLERLRAPCEPRVKIPPRDSAPKYLRARADLIRKSEDWWSTIPPFKLGMDIWELAHQTGYRRMILTQGPKRNPNAWSGKKIWIDRNLGQEVDITITRDKGLVYGRVLVDDWPEYIERWLKWRPRGLVIMPASSYNKPFKHPQVIRYTGKNLVQVRQAMVAAYRSPDWQEKRV